VLAALVAGRTNGEIARTLFISVKTASVHVSNILRKLAVPNRNEAARLGYRLGLAAEAADAAAADDAAAAADAAAADADDPGDPADHGPDGAAR
jgi:hypothetical protein